MTRLFRALPVLMAATALSSCSTLTPEPDPSPYGAFLAARYAGVNRDAGRAAEFYAEALARAPGDVTLTDRAFITAVLAGDLTRAADLAADTVAVGDPSRLATLYLAADQLAERRYGDAETLLDEAPHFGAFNRFLADFLYQWALVGQGRVDEALSAAEAMSAPGFLASHLGLHKALMLDHAGRFDAADAAYRSATYASPFQRFSTLLYGEFLERRGRRVDAGELYRAHLLDHPDDAPVRAAADRVESGRRAPPRPSLPALAARALFGPAASLVASAEMDLSVIYLRMAQRLDPDLAVTRMLLGETLQRIRLPEAALVEYAAVEDGPYHLAAEIDRIWLLGRLSRLEEGTLAARRLVAAEDDPEARLVLADFLRVQGQCEEARQLYRQVIATRQAAGVPVDWRVYYFLAACLIDADDWPGAEAAYLAALEEAPDQAVLLNDLGYLWIERGENLDRAFGMIARAAELDPEDGNFIDSLGWAHYQLGDYDTAVLELERATELDPGNVAANLHLGDAYWQVGRRLEAGFQWRRAMDMSPRPDQLEALEYRLAHGRPPAEAATAAGAEVEFQAGAPAMGDPRGSATGSEQAGEP
ncbi:tetratricopeptide repeat protein [Maricaulis sp. CAU 1757]